MAGTGKGSGSGIFTDLKKVRAEQEEHAKRLKEHAKVLREHDERLRGHDEEIAEIDADLLTVTNVSMTLAEVCMRARRRQSAREKLAKIRERREK